jgi:hypothetical protein
MARRKKSEITSGVKADEKPKDDLQSLLQALASSERQAAISKNFEEMRAAAQALQERISQIPESQLVRGLQALNRGMRLASITSKNLTKEDLTSIDEALSRYEAACESGDLAGKKQLPLQSGGLAKPSESLAAETATAVKAARDALQREIAEKRRDNLLKGKRKKSAIIDASIEKHAAAKMKGRKDDPTAEDLAGKIESSVAADLKAAGYKPILIDAIATRIRESGGPRNYRS